VGYVTSMSLSLEISIAHMRHRTNHCSAKNRLFGSLMFLIFGPGLFAIDALIAKQFKETV
jgi:hypothetical protein